MRSCTRRVVTPQSVVVSLMCVALFVLLTQSGCVTSRIQALAPVSGTRMSEALPIKVTRAAKIRRLYGLVADGR